MAAVAAVVVMLTVVPGPFRAEAGFIVLGGLAFSWAIIFTERYIARYGIVATCLQRENFDPDTVWLHLNNGAEDAWRRLRAEQAGNVIVYQGPLPFLGAGEQIGEDPAWQLVVDVERPKKTQLGNADSPPQPFELDDLHDHMSKALNQLNMDGLLIEDHLYVDVPRDTPPDKEFWDAKERRPITRVDDDVMRSYMRTPGETVRHFRAVRVVAWSGQLVVTVFVHLARARSLLYMRTRYHCLTPLKPAFRQVDRVPPGPTLADLLRQAGAAVSEVIGAFVHPSRWFRPVAALEYLRYRILQGREDGMVAEMRERLGWYRPISLYRTSIRARASDRSPRRYFQLVDQAKNIRMVERCLLNSLVTFLDEHGIDTSELVRQQMTIQNNGVIVSGNGQINARNLAVGDNAMAGDQLLDDE